jgi:uncharacterized RDD family membrane protein YckC
MGQVCQRCKFNNDDASLFCSECSNALQATKNDHLLQNSGSEIEQAKQNRPQNVYADVIGLRIAAVLMDVGVNVLSQIPLLGWLLNCAWNIWTLILGRRGQNASAKILKIRIVRKNGDLSGFYHTYTRACLGILMLLFIPIIGWLGTGYWTAFFHPNRQTWHDRLMSTYVIRDSPELVNLPGTSARGAKIFFWVTCVCFILSLLMMIIIFINFLQ